MASHWQASHGRNLGCGVEPCPRGPKRQHVQASLTSPAQAQVWASPGTSAHLSRAFKNFFPELRTCLLFPFWERKAWGFGTNHRSLEAFLAISPQRDGRIVFHVNKIFNCALLFLNSGLFMYLPYPRLLLYSFSHYPKLPVIFFDHYSTCVLSLQLRSTYFVIQYGEPAMV